MKHRGLLVVLVAAMIPFVSFANIALVREMAEQGNVDAQYYMGFCYQYGNGVSENDKEALKWYRLAAEKGNLKAQYVIGVFYELGLGVPENGKEALKWYRLAAEQGLAEAQRQLGYCYEEGELVQKNDKEALKWYRLAAEQGFPDAQVSMGKCYMEGIGVAKDQKEAVKWLLLSACRMSDLSGFDARRHLEKSRVDFSSRSNVVYIITNGTRKSTSIGVVQGHLTEGPTYERPHSEVYALDLNTGDLISERGRYILTFRDMSSDVLFGQWLLAFDLRDNQTDPPETINYKFNRFTGTYEITGDRSPAFKTTITGTFTTKKQKGRIF